MGAELRQLLWHKIEQEFQEPVADVILGLREENSWRTVAGALDISLSTLVKWRKALGLPLDKSCIILDESSLPETTPTDRKAEKMGYKDAQDAVVDMRLVQQLSLIDCAKRLDVCVGTIVRYTPKELKNKIYICSDAWWVLRREQVARMTELSLAARKRNGHLWEALNDEIFINGKR